MANLNLTDALLIQRLDTDASSPEMYAITLEKFSEFVTLNNDVIVSDLKDQVDLNTFHIQGLLDNYAQFDADLKTVYADVTRNSNDIENLKGRTVTLEDKVSLFDTRAKVHLFYKWVENEGNERPGTGDINPGEMITVFDDNGDIEFIYYSTVDHDGTPIGQPYVFEDETIEITSSFHPDPGQVSKLRYRSIHLLIGVPVARSEFVELQVKTLHSFMDGDSYPYYEADSPQPAMTRSDFYPMAANLDDLKEYVETNYLARSGSKSMFGDLTIEKNSPNVIFRSADNSNATIDTDGIGSLHLLYGSGLRIELDENGVKLHTTIDANSNEITNVGSPNFNNSAATKKYVDESIEGIDFSQVGIEEIFNPGDQVAQLNTGTGVEPGGFYIINKTLYVKMP